MAESMTSSNSSSEENISRESISGKIIYLLCVPIILAMIQSVLIELEYGTFLATLNWIFVMTHVLLFYKTVKFNSIILIWIFVFAFVYVISVIWRKYFVILTLSMHTLSFLTVNGLIIYQNFCAKPQENISELSTTTTNAESLSYPVNPVQQYIARINDKPPKYDPPPNYEEAVKNEKNVN